MEQRFYLGIDNGGTLTKAVLFDAAGHEVAQASESVPLLTPAPGFTERDMEALYAANCRCIRRVAEESGVPPRGLRGSPAPGTARGFTSGGGMTAPSVRASSRPTRARGNTRGGGGRTGRRTAPSERPTNRCSPASRSACSPG